MHQLTYIKNMPKVELHAHLNGSLSIESIKELAERLDDTNKAKQIQKVCEQIVDFDSLDKCFLKFRFMHDLTSTRRGLQLATELVVRDFAKDNVIYLELRTTPKNNAEMSKKDYLICVLETIQQSMKTENIHISLLPSIDRAQNAADAEDTVDLALQLRDKYDGIITGIDFSGNPKEGNFMQFMPALERARSNNLKLAIHCGEINNPHEIEQMIKFGMDRCGHGTFLSEQQLRELGSKQVAIECCLTSNVKCRTVACYDEHHFKRIWQTKVAPILLCTDDCGVFDTTLTKEFALAKEMYKLGVSDLWSLLKSAVKYAFAEEKTKEKLLREILSRCEELTKEAQETPK